MPFVFFFSSRRRHTRYWRDWSSDVCSSDLTTFLGVMQAREHRAEAASVERFFTARSVAVVGASRRQDAVGQALVRNLVLGDFQGRVYVVNPAADSVVGMPAFPSVADIPHDVDIAIVAVPAESVPDVVLDCAKKGVHGLDRKSTRLNSSHANISYAVFCLKKK